MANPTNVLWIMGGRGSGKTTTLLELLEAHGESDSVVISPSKEMSLCLQETAKRKGVTKGVFRTVSPGITGLGRNRIFFVDGWEMLDGKEKSSLESYIYQGCRFYITSCTE